MPSSLLLHRDVHYCEADRTFVFLDTGTGNYFHLPEKQSLSFAEILESAQPCDLPDQARRLARALVARRVLTHETDTGKPLNRVQIRPPKASIFDGLAPAGRLHIAAVPGILAATLPSWRAVRTGDLKRTLALANMWKRRCTADPDMAPSHIAGLVRDFHSASPLLFSAHDACFFRSLVLLNFLSTRGVPADWVFGVRFGPFRAHCWIEHQGIVLNDFLENIADYHPILIV